MHGFVASWFFPPSTSSEGIVAFKQLSHSKHTYDVCSSLSRQWGFDAESKLQSPNINALPVKTDSIDEWVDESVRIFEERHAQKPYDFLMTRSMPPESIIIGERIKRAHPDLPWVSSLNDPISRVPHMMRDLLDDTQSLTKTQKRQLREDLNSMRDCSHWIGMGDAGVDLLCKYKSWEREAILGADALIFPSGPQAHFMLCGYQRDHVHIIPHSFDRDLYIRGAERKDGKIGLVFLGQAYKDRSLEPIIHALHLLDINNPDALHRLHVRLIGGVTDGSRSLVWNYSLTDCVSIEPGVDYVESLRLMDEADWLIHVDGDYPVFSSTGGSVYLAGKLADYMGAGKPIFAITGMHSPADRLVKSYGGCVFGAADRASMADALEQIALGTLETSINEQFADSYSAEHVGAQLDNALTELSKSPIADINPPITKTAGDEKLLSVCIPSYNVAQTLPRCLDSLLGCEHPELLDVMVVNDGSHDATHDIAKRYEEACPGIIRLIDKENGGHGSTINTGLRYATGTYFRVLDGDDWLDSVELTAFLSKLKKLNQEVDLISTDYCQINMVTGKIDHITKKSHQICYDTIYPVSKLKLNKEYFSLGSTTYRTGMLREHGLSLSEHSFYVDVEYQMFPLPWVETVMFTGGNLYHYAVGNEGQSVSKTSFVNRYDNHDKVMRRVLDYYLCHRDEMCSAIDEYYEYLILHHFLNTQFTISLVYDQNRERGCKRAMDFDMYLKGVNEDWYREAGKLYSTLRFARKHHYKADELPVFNNLKYRDRSIVRRAGIQATETIMNSGFGRVVSDGVTKWQRRR